MQNRLNLIIIALLCSTTLAPCVIFFVRGPGEWTWLIAFLALSYLVSLLRKSFYDRCQVSKNTELYKNLQVHQFKKWVTDGDLINKKIRQKFPTYRNVYNLDTIRAKLAETYTIEKSHTVLFVFCLLTSVYAFLVHSYGTAILVFIGNILFNFYPNLLQQYNRIRYATIVEKYG